MPFTGAKGENVSETAHLVRAFWLLPPFHLAALITKQCPNTVNGPFPNNGAASSSAASFIGESKEAFYFSWWEMGKSCLEIVFEPRAG